MPDLADTLDSKINMFASRVCPSRLKMRSVFVLSLGVQLQVFGVAST